VNLRSRSLSERKKCQVVGVEGSGKLKDVVSAEGFLMACSLQGVVAPGIAEELPGV
jgi:hypothetical protein